MTELNGGEKIACESKADLESKVIEIAGEAPPDGIKWTDSFSTRWGRNSKGRKNQRFSFKGTAQGIGLLRDHASGKSITLYVKGLLPTRRVASKPPPVQDVSAEFKKLKPLRAHAYFKRKGVAIPEGARALSAADGSGRTRPLAVLPLYVPDGRMVSWQTIDPHAKKPYDKLYKKGPKLPDGHFFPFLPADHPKAAALENIQGERIYLAEGIATTATVFQAVLSQYPALAAYTKQNLIPLARVLLEKTKATIILCLDNDGPEDKQKEKQGTLKIPADLAEEPRIKAVCPAADGKDFNDCRDNQSEMQKLINLKPLYTQSAPEAGGTIQVKGTGGATKDKKETEPIKIFSTAIEGEQVAQEYFDKERFISKGCLHLWAGETAVGKTTAGFSYMLSCEAPLYISSDYNENKPLKYKGISEAIPGEHRIRHLPGISALFDDAMEKRDLPSAFQSLSDFMTENDPGIVFFDPFPEILDMTKVQNARRVLGPLTEILDKNADWAVVMAWGLTKGEAALRQRSAGSWKVAALARSVSYIISLPEGHSLRNGKASKETAVADKQDPDKCESKKPSPEISVLFNAKTSRGKRPDKMIIMTKREAQGGIVHYAECKAEKIPKGGVEAWAKPEDTEAAEREKEARNDARFVFLSEIADKTATGIKRSELLNVWMKRTGRSSRTFKNAVAWAKEKGYISADTSGEGQTGLIVYFKITSAGENYLRLE